MNNDVFGMVAGLIIYILISFPVYAHYRTSILDIRYKYRTFWPRFFAPNIDSLILLPLVSGSHLLLLYLELPSAIIILLTAVMLSAYPLYTIYFHGKYGQTVGKMACKVKVVRATTEEQISFARAFVRDSFPLLFSLPLLISTPNIMILTPEEEHEFFITKSWLFLIPMIWFWAEVITMLTNDKRRAIHDFIAGTVVVRTNIMEETGEAQEKQAAKPDSVNVEAEL